MKSERASEPSGSREAEAENVREEDGVDPAIERVLQRVDLRNDKESVVATEVPTLEAAPRLRMARLSRIDAGRVYLRMRGRHEEVEADVDDDVDIELLMRSIDAGQAVLIEEEPGMLPVVVGTVQTRVPDTLELRARKIVIEGEEEVLMRSGTGAMRVRQDGDVELVGSRITTMSRGLFRIVGRMLRLN